MARRPRLPRRSKPSIPERAAAPIHRWDANELHAKLAEIYAEAGEDRPRIIQTLTEFRSAAMAETRSRFDQGRLGGLETARLIASIHDVLVQAIHKFVTQQIKPVPNPTASEIMAVCAVGGFGRREMAPQSDLDLLFLQADSKGSAHTESVTEYMLYLLWDLGLKVGHATRSIEQSIKLAKSDQTILTALLDLRYICGDLPLTQKLYQKFRKDVARGKGRHYISEKLEERDARHAREGNSRYVIEPNIKEGKGGLRDLHVLYWIARFLDKGGSITDAQDTDDYVSMGLFDQTAATRFSRAADFLWRTRIHLHFETGRAVENLNFDHQTVLARKMGYASGPIEEAVERFMREYFINARQVGALTRIACAKLEAEKSIILPKGLDALLPNSKRNMKEDGFILDHGRLMFKDPMTLRERPSLIMELFEIAGRRNLDIHPDALSAIDFRRNLIDNSFRRDTEISRTFQSILLGAKAPYATLKVMNESGVLGRYLLEFGGIVARTQFNMHHAYTVDEHTLHLVNHYHDFEYGEWRDGFPELSDIIARFSKDQRLSLYMACLLHDTGKGQGDQCIEGARLARRACRRLGLPKSIVDNVAWLVRRHLDMSETAQRRDISNPQTIEAFGALVGSQARLDMLYALTVVDIMSVGPGVWNDWKKVLLRDLYLATTDFLSGHLDLELDAIAMAAREQLAERLPGDLAQRITPLTDGLGPSYWNAFDMADLVRHARWYDQVVKSGQATAIKTRLDRPSDITELWVLGENRPGLFSDLTLAITASGAQIMGARLHTGKGGRVMDVFYLQNTEGLAFGRKNPALLEALTRRSERALHGDISGLSVSASAPSRRAAAIPIDPVIRILETETENVFIVEIESRDRKGLLHDVAECLYRADLDILSAHIEVVGARAIDAFYVQPTATFTRNAQMELEQALLSNLEPERRAGAA